MVDLFKRPEIELRNVEWHIKIFKDKISIEHRASGQKLEITDFQDLKSLLGILGSAITSRS